MTVCIAAICEFQDQTMIVGAADRLITYDDTEFEQPHPKILQLASHTVALTSGNTADHVAIYLRVLARGVELGDRPTVAIIATLYAQEMANLRRAKAEQKHLIPLGLNVWTFLNKTTNLPPDVASDLSEKMAKEDLGIAAIIAGTDQFGAHVYLVEDPGEAICCDWEGWAVIGSGYRHADLQFIDDKYHRGCQFDEAFLLTYRAKKSADIATGVGKTTDLFWVSGDGYRLLKPSTEIVRLVKKLHSDLEMAEKKQRTTAKKRIRRFVQGEIKKQPPAEQERLEAPQGLDASDNEKTVSGGT
jgi:20S proteasome alpha/beta subunit